MQPTQEQWRPVVGFEGSYEVSDHGSVRGKERKAKIRGGHRKILPSILSPVPTAQKGYLAVHFWRDNIRTVHYIHTLVLEAFVGPRPIGLYACHNDGDHLRNYVDNLRWDTQSENNLDAVRHGKNANANKTECFRGHPLSGDNLYINPSSGGRTCRQCMRDKRGVQNPYGPRT
jgi:hypothetical protein